VQVVLKARGADSERLEALVTRREERSDRLVPRQERHDPLLLGPDVPRRRPPDLGRHLPHQRGRLLLDRPERVFQAIVDRVLQGFGQPVFGGGHQRLRGHRLAYEAGTPQQAGVLRPVGRTGLGHDEVLALWGPRVASAEA
jgi:hypothetical protein